MKTDCFCIDGNQIIVTFLDSDFNFEAKKPLYWYRFEP